MRQYRVQSRVPKIQPLENRARFCYPKIIVAKISIEKNGDALLAQIIGSVDETGAIFDALLKSLPAKTLRVSCKRIERFNSTGIRAWIRAFKDIVAKGTELVFEECPPAMVEQFNVISNFTAGGRVESVYLPYCCESCHATLVQLAPLAKLLQIYKNLPELACPKCGGKAVFDEFPEDYFAFIERGLNAKEDSTPARGVARPPSSPPGSTPAFGTVQPAPGKTPKVVPPPAPGKKRA